MIGVQLTEFLLAILATQIIVMIMQTFLIFVLMLFVFNVPCNGSIAVAILVTILQGLCGMCFGNATFCLKFSYCLLLSSYHNRVAYFFVSRFIGIDTMR